jgi:hypothetical protein
MKGEERMIYYYTSRNTGKLERVFCSRYEYLFLKFHYDIDGLTADEYAEYKGYCSVAE